ncbi:MAG: 3-phosphoserine/phosphohydroxythreonine transaminase [Gammaproteobacteria bacterium]|nr:MAG: 3-phosphoserine/phosphohydroxythreonine transaminase [Gammaproteobacteria bacterium]PIE34825.1 MAG: 3-phosphoserine/phosphohydroxythreonine transaminase [Gammaproteobacteria bacterium]
MTEAATRLDNFNPGPAVLPLPVLERIRDELLDMNGTGISVLEMGHRSDAFGAIAAKAEHDLRSLLAIPDNYRVLFMQGGATAQFSLAVQNLDHRGRVAFANTGHWSAKAIDHASRLTEVSVVAELESVREAGEQRLSVPDVSRWRIPEDASFLHVTDNETIGGIVLDALPELDDRDLPIVCDMSSSILSRPLDVSRYGLIYAGAQKNIGPAGLTLVIVRDDLLTRSAGKNHLPPVFDYEAIADAGSMLNTPPVFAWYVAGLVFEWLIEQGGLEAMAARNRRQSEALYALIDAEALYTNPVAARNRSWMNVPLTLPDASLTSTFLAASVHAGMVGLKGHKSVGGVRVSLYNALEDDALERLLAFMREFAEANRNTPA